VNGPPGYPFKAATTTVKGSQ